MRGRDKLFFNLLTFLLLFVIGLVIYKTREVDKQIKRWQSEIRRRQERGVEDPQLKETVDKLEHDLRTRLAEGFELEPDPLDLTRVIHTRKFLKKVFGELPEVETRMRLSCTVTGEDGNAAAVIKWEGRSNVVCPGDVLGGYRVESIGVNRVILLRGGERLVLVTEKAPDTIQQEEKAGGGVAREPVVEVKQVSIENY